jgi:hypothetical protein
MEELLECIHCECPIDKKELKEWRWTAWRVGGGGMGTPHRAPGVKRDNFDLTFHKDCFVEWLTNRDEGVQDIDRPVNACKYFQRTGSSMHGYYVRDNKRHACLGTWLQSDVWGQSLFPIYGGTTELRLDFEYCRIVIDKPQEMLESFRRFLSNNGWLEDWYEPRKPYKPKSDVADHRRAIHWDEIHDLDTKAAQTTAHEKMKERFMAGEFNQLGDVDWAAFRLANYQLAALEVDSTTAKRMNYWVNLWLRSSASKTTGNSKPTSA